MSSPKIWERSLHTRSCQVTLLSPNTCCTWLPILPLSTGKNIQTGVGSGLKKTRMKHLIFHVVVFLSFSCVTIWPNLFFWACHGKAAHPANMPDEVWSLHPNPALLPSAHIPVQLSSLVEVDVTYRCWPRVRSLLIPTQTETSEADHRPVIHNMLTLHPLTGPFSLQSCCCDITKITDIRFVHSAFIFFYLATKALALHY